MRLILTALFLTSLYAPCTALATQDTPSPSSATSSASGTPSTIMRPALDTLQQTLGTLHPEKWKTSSALRDETDSNITSIRHDLETTLPPLLTTADEAPDSVARALPAFRNIEALYDVLLRVAQVARLSAPGSQAAAVEQALQNLEDGRRALGDRLQAAATEQEQQLVELKAALRAVPPPPAPASVIAPPPPADKKRKPRSKPAQKTPPPPPSAASTLH